MNREYSNVMLQRHGARHIYPIPHGLKELMMDISREVLRRQPEHIYAFCADYCEALLITRENARVAASVFESITDCSITIAELLQKTSIHRACANEKVAIIQKTFKKFLEKQRGYPEQSVAESSEEHMLSKLLIELDMPLVDLERTANIIKSAYRIFKERQKIFRENREFIDWRKALHNTIHIYRKTGIPEDVVQRAAYTIKAAYREYYMRRHLINLAKSRRRVGECLQKFPFAALKTFERLNIDPCNKKVQEAAIKVQRAVREYLSRVSAEYIAKDVIEALKKTEKPQYLMPEMSKFYQMPDQSVIKKSVAQTQYQKERDELSEVMDVEEEEQVMQETKEEAEYFPEQEIDSNEYTVEETQLSPTAKKIEQTEYHLKEDAFSKEIKSDDIQIALTEEEGQIQEMISQSFDSMTKQTENLEQDHQVTFPENILIEHEEEKVMEVEDDKGEYLEEEEQIMEETTERVEQFPESVLIEQEIVQDDYATKETQLTPTAKKIEVTTEYKEETITSDTDGSDQTTVEKTILRKEYDEMKFDDLTVTFLEGEEYIETTDEQNSEIFDTIMKKVTKMAENLEEGHFSESDLLEQEIDGNEYTIKETQLSPTAKKTEEIVKRKGSDSEYKRTDIVTPTSHLREETVKSDIVGPDQTTVQMTIVRKEYHRKEGESSKEILVPNDISAGLSEGEEHTIEGTPQ